MADKWVDTGFSEPYGPFSAADAKKIIAEITKPKPKPKGTQAGHAVTDSKNNTKPLTPAQKQAEAKRPAVGNDAAVAKKVQGPSHNNGYTN
jgi:hypothetical protein